MRNKTTSFKFGHFKLTSLSVCMLSAAAVSYAQPSAVPPIDAGGVTQQNRPQVPEPTTSNFKIQFDGDAAKEVAAGGPVVELKKLLLTGNQLFSADDILASLGKVEGQSYDLAGFRAMTNRISQYYRDRGYPFARALIPAQDMKGGVLTIQVMEGYYGRVSASSPNKRTEKAVQEYLAPIKPGDPIAAKKLERSILILNDLPGLKAVPVIRPGEQVGTGDLNVLLKEEKVSAGEMAVDNLGSRYTGYNRFHGSYRTNQIFRFGDELSVRGMITDETMVFGRLSYSAPLAPNGLRGSASYSRTQYELGKDFSALKAVGISDQYALGVNYPILRSQLSNINLSSSLQYKDIVDDFKSTGTKFKKSSTTLPLSIGFNHRDRILGGGVTYGEFSYTSGSMRNANDFANTKGSFNKSNFDLFRQQALTSAMSVYVRYSSQHASKNLDSSEDMFLGGKSGVRAYPQGEAAGDKGQLVTLEARYQIGSFSPYAFYDYGKVETYARPTEDLISETRKLSGGGIGVRYHQGNWNIDVTTAWRNKGGKPTSDLFKDPSPRTMISVGHKF